jgi:hypothetical protein
MHRIIVAIILLVLTLPAQAYESPPRGTATRADLMDALRPIAEWTLGAPVQFVVNDIRVSGNVAFVSVTAQRPGGAPINIRNTPLVLRDMIEPDMIDGTNIQALLQKSGRMWVPVHQETGATDVWYAWPALCPVWGPVLPEICQ